MRILMLGNSFTFYNDMPSMLAELTGAEVIHHTRGGARLAEQFNPETQMGSKTLEALEKDSWDYVVLQEMSNGPIIYRESFMNSVSSLCEKIRAVGAIPILYATWAYQKDCDKLEEMGLAYDIMAAQLSSPITVWINLCDREPEREQEVMDLIHRHVLQFFEVYQKQSGL